MESSGTAPGGTATPEENEELVRFREQWRQEVQRKRQQEGVPAPLPSTSSKQHTSKPAVGRAGQSNATAALPRSGAPQATSTREHVEPELAAALERTHISTSPSTSPRKLARPISPIRTRIAPRQHTAGHHTSQASSSSHKQSVHDTASAVDLYGRAVHHEQQGQLNDALRLYRRAYKLDSSVDKVFNRSAAAQEVEQAAADQRAFEELEVVDPAKVIDAKPAPIEPYTFHNYSQLHPDYAPPSSGARQPPDVGRRKKATAATSALLATRTDPLSRIIRNFKPPGWDAEHPDPDSTGDPAREHNFEAEEDKFPLYIASLPDEVLEHVVDFMDVQTVERFAKVNKKTRILTAGAAKWR